MEYASPILVFILSAAAVAILGLASTSTQPDQRGWRPLAPSAMHWTGLWLSAALSGFMSYIYLFVGSTRPDAAHQMQILFWLIIAFSFGSIISAISIRLVRRAAILWRGTKISFNGSKGTEVRPLSDIDRLKSNLFGSVMICFRDGTTLQLDPYASGAEELLEKISAMLEPAGGASNN